MTDFQVSADGTFDNTGTYYESVSDTPQEPFFKVRLELQGDQLKLTIRQVATDDVLVGAGDPAGITCTSTWTDSEERMYAICQEALLRGISGQEFVVQAPSKYEAEELVVDALHEAFMVIIGEMAVDNGDPQEQ